MLVTNLPIHEQHISLQGEVGSLFGNIRTSKKSIHSRRGFGRVLPRKFSNNIFM
jgi:hypothetical protein